MVDKLQQSKKEANHKLRSLRQKIARQNVEPVLPVFDLSESEGDAIIEEDEWRRELELLRLNASIEDERLRRLVHGSGQGRPKSAEFEFAARTILATGIPNTEPNPQPNL